MAEMQGHSDAAHQNNRQHAEARHDRRMEVDPANPCGNAHAEGEAEYCADRSQRGGFGGKESADQSFGSAQRFHDGKVAAPVKDPSHQGGEHAQSGGQQ